MAGWFNIDYLRDPSFMKSAGGGNVYTAMGDVLSKFGGIINAERDRKYQLEQDKLKNERENIAAEFKNETERQKAGYYGAGGQERMANAHKHLVNANNDTIKTQGQLGRWSVLNSTDISRANAYNRQVDGGLVLRSAELDHKINNAKNTAKEQKGGMAGLGDIMRIETPELAQTLKEQGGNVVNIGGQWFVAKNPIGVKAHAELVKLLAENPDLFGEEN